MNGGWIICGLYLSIYLSTHPSHLCVCMCIHLSIYLSGRSAVSELVEAWTKHNEELDRVPDRSLVIGVDNEMRALRMAGHEQ